jgi:alkaline phosphatase
MKLCHKFLILFIPFYLLFSVLDLWAGPSQEEEKAIPKNIILFIGDGMGIGQITAAKIDKGELNLERFKTVGLLSVFPADFFLPSSEASTTAIATGFKTNKAYIGVSTSGEPLNTVLEYAEERGKSTGLVVTSSLVETTPACFASHELSRHEKRAIAESLVDSGVDVMFGGGLLDFRLLRLAMKRRRGI